MKLPISTRHPLPKIKIDSDICKKSLIDVYLFEAKSILRPSILSLCLLFVFLALFSTLLIHDNIFDGYKSVNKNKITMKTSDVEDTKISSTDPQMALANLKERLLKLRMHNVLRFHNSQTSYQKEANNEQITDDLKLEKAGKVSTSQALAFSNDNQEPFFYAPNELPNSNLRKRTTQNYTIFFNDELN